MTAHLRRQIERQFSRRSVVLTQLIMIVLLSGCATTITQTHYQLYSGAPKSLEEIAVVKGGGRTDSWQAYTTVILCKVDGKPGPNKHFRGLAFSPVSVQAYGDKEDNWSFVIELEPGEHMLEIDYENNTVSYTTSTVTRAKKPFPTLTFDAKPGAEYVVEMVKSKLVIRRTN